MFDDWLGRFPSAQRNPRLDVFPRVNANSAFIDDCLEEILRYLAARPAMPIQRKKATLTLMGTPSPDWFVP